MVGGLRKFLQGSTGKAAGIVLVAAALGLMVFVLKDSFTGRAAAMSRDRMFICSKTGKTFEYTLKVGDKLPVQSPHSGEKTGYPAEACFWTADGGIKKEPTWVLLNQYAGKPGPTYCPDCGRIVTALNQPAMQGMKPPAKKDEIKSSQETR